MIEWAIEKIREFYKKYYDALPDKGQDELRAELNADVHNLERVVRLFDKAMKWEQRYLAKRGICREPIMRLPVLA